ncbi:MAG: hypothetical protein ACP5DZ_06070 [Bacteroidales bacterium]
MKKWQTAILLIFYLICIVNKLNAQDKFSGQWFMGFQHQEEEDYNQFLLKRAYISYEKQITPWLSGRITPDITIDSEGMDKGNVELRLKYLYAQFDLPDFLFFTGNNIKTGLTPRPWIGYEQDINIYRSQGKMFLERTHVINSTDFGIHYHSNIGNHYEQSDFETACPGTYGNVVLGVFNGGGYHALEENKNKTVEWRFTFRPFPEHFGGLLATYHGAWGHGNSVWNNTFRLNGVHLGYEHKYFVLSGQYYQGLGSFGDDLVSLVANTSIPHDGYSLFGEFRHPKTGLGAWVRYDHQNLEYTDAFAEERIIVSAVWRFYNNNKIILSYDHFLEGLGDIPSTIYEVTLEIRF